MLWGVIAMEKISVDTNGTGRDIGLWHVHEFMEYIAKLRGSLSAYPDFSVDSFLARKHADKELDR